MFDIYGSTISDNAAEATTGSFSTYLLPALNLPRNTLASVQFHFLGPRGPQVTPLSVVV